MSGSFKEQLLQAGLITPEQVESIEQRNKAKAEVAKSQPSTPSRTSPRPQTQRTPSPPRERAEAPPDGDDVLAKFRVSIPVKGQKRWYVEARDGRIVYLSISETCGEFLERGQAAIVELNNGTHRIINREGALFLQQQDPSSIRCWNPAGHAEST